MSLGVLTDLEQDEARKVFGGEQVTSDHVLEVHQFLKENSGSIASWHE
jgi:hypothetical protein